MFHKDMGDILLFEDKSGMADYMFEQDLRATLEMAKTKPEVVYVSSCMSEFAGKIFFEAGAKHVICIREG